MFTCTLRFHPLIRLSPVLLAACGIDNASVVHNDAPEATLIAPIEGGTLYAGSRTTLAGRVQDREAESPADLLVSWYADGVEICPGTTADDAGDVSCPWTVELGIERISLLVIDAEGDEAEDSASITVIEDAPPEIAVTSPGPEETLYSDIPVELVATVSDAEDRADALAVSWTSNVGGDLGSSTPDSNGRASLAASLAQGDHLLAATVSDSAGNTVSETLLVTVNGPNTGPACGFSAPLDGEAFDQGETVLFSGSAADAESPSEDLSVALSSNLDPEFGPEPTVDSAGDWDWPEANLSAGTHVITLTVSDPVGVTCTETVIVEVCGTPWYPDADGDMAGDDDGAVAACDAPVGYVSGGGDCDDEDPYTGPGAAFNDSATLCMTDADGDGWGDASPPAAATAGGDCDDADPRVSPDATEVCDEVDNDCDGSIDEEAGLGSGTTYYLDADTDGYGLATSTTSACSAPSGYVVDGSDCDDGDATAYPGAAETCDGVDDDCDGEADNGAMATWYADADTDGYGDASEATEACAAPSGYVADDSDCDDANASVSPGASELCNEIDDDCDGGIDDGASGLWYIDRDGDGWGDDDDVSTDCEAPEGHVSAGGDCHDGDEHTWPGAAEEESPTACMQDGDEDGFGDDAPPAGVDAGTDCDDQDAGVSPDGIETCDDVDQDCDGVVDEGTTITVYADGDGDSHGDPATTDDACAVSSGWVADGDDCDDAQEEVHPGAEEVCNGLDDDCDAEIDDADAGVDASTGDWFYADADEDGFGDAADAVAACDAPAGYVAGGEDCDDADGAVNPSATESCNAIDDDCDGTTDEGASSTWYADADADGYGDPALTTEACTAPTGWVADNDDCDDTDGAVSPAGTEVCNDIDDDCDGSTDDDDASLDTTTGDTWYLDVDEDGYGDASSTVEACRAPSGYADGADDCDDADPGVNPGATEVCNDGIDNNCDGGASSCGTGERALVDADVVLHTDYSDDTPSDLAFMPDTDGDGDDELWVSAQYYDGSDTRSGRVYLVPGGFTGDGYLSAEADGTISGDSADEALAQSLVSGDIDGDGIADGIVGSAYDSNYRYQGGSVGVFFSPFSGTALQTDADLLVYGSSADDVIGAQVAVLPDYDGDGDDELLLAGHHDDGAVSNEGAAYIIEGGATGTLYIDSAYASGWYGASTGDDFGGNPDGIGTAVAGDIDGDGAQDLVFAAEGHASRTGRVYLVLGPPGGGNEAIGNVADVIVTGDAPGDHLGQMVAAAGDVDDDGYHDLLMTASGAGMAWVELGSAGISGTRSTAALDIEIDGGGEYFGGCAAGLGDLDGDGRDDIGVTTEYRDDYASNGGVVYVFHAPLASAMTEADAGLVLYGGEEEWVGRDLRSGDWDGDERLDVATVSEATGVVYVWLGEGL